MDFNNVKPVMDKKLCDQELRKEAADQVRMQGMMCDGRWSRDSERHTLTGKFPD